MIQFLAVSLPRLAAKGLHSLAAAAVLELPGVAVAALVDEELPAC
jgi:hypothetical protein